MEASHLLIFGIVCFGAGFLTHLTFFPIIREYLILRNGHVYQVGETLPDDESIGYPDLRYLERSNVSNPTSYHPAPPTEAPNVPPPVPYEYHRYGTADWWLERYNEEP
jgi:hypothetical protein